MKKTITRRSLLAALASFSFFIPTTALSAKGRELAIFYSFSGNSKRVAEVFQKLEHCDVLEIKTLEPYNWIFLIISAGFSQISVSVL